MEESLSAEPIEEEQGDYGCEDLDGVDHGRGKLIILGVVFFRFDGHVAPVDHDGVDSGELLHDD